MKNLGLAALVCCVLGMELLGVGKPKDTEQGGLALHATTTVGKLHVDLRKAANGPFHVSLGYGAGHGSERAETVSLTLGSSTEEV